MKIVTLSFLGFLISHFFYAQQGDGGLPKGKSNDQQIKSYFFARPDVEALRLEDQETDGKGIAPWRFGFNHNVQLTLDQDGSWINLPDGSQLWRLEVVCEKALTVNLTFENVVIPEGNELYVYNPSKDFILGKFTQYHTYQGELGTELIPGNKAIVEYYIPAQNKNLPRSLTLNTVTHGYRTSKEFAEKAFGSSGNCNLNVNCPEGSAWTNERNSVVMLVSGSNGFCTGALVNNTANDFKPYVLTANHCYSNPATWIFRFNWQAASCTNPGASPSFTSLSGATLRSKATASDFCLVEITGGLINNTVPLAYNPYFAGWDNSGAIPNSAVGIHHPSGDIKKISFENNPLISTVFGSSPADSHWGVTWWDLGVTEGGSSGSPLFDQNHRVVGQLHGGASGCGNPQLSDEYGKFSYSWEPVGSNSTNQLKFWLDPSNSGATFVDGSDPSGPPLALDGSTGNISGASGILCNTNPTPSFTLTNMGTSPLTSATISYGYDGVLNQNYNWTGNLAQFGSSVINLPAGSVAGGNHTFGVNLTQVNGVSDPNAINNQATSNFTKVVNGENVQLNLDLDCYASETSWTLTDAQSNTLYASPGYADGTPGLVQYNFCLSAGCYNFTINDSYGDGMTTCTTVNGGSGSYAIVQGSDSLAFLTEANANFGTSNTKNFCVASTASLDELAFTVSLFPNPANSSVMIASEVPFTSVNLYAMNGVLVASFTFQDTHSTNVPLDQIANGIYQLQMVTDKGILNRKLQIQH